MAAKPARGEVWLVDLGFAAKVRPALVLSVPVIEQAERALTTLVPHTTSTRNSPYEVLIDVPFLKSGAFDAQNILTIPAVKLVRRLGMLSPDQMSTIEASVMKWLGLTSGS